MSPEPLLSRAGRWFEQSGIQEPQGGVARYYRTDLEQNHAVSTEITGYALSTLVFLDQMDGALAAARFLCRHAWDGQSMPFETEPSPEGRFTYFFDCGIIVRGLLACWRVTGEAELLGVATRIGESMACDFASTPGDYHPILRLPQKQALARDPLRWSRSPGCYQLKSGMAWQELYEATGNPRFRELYEGLLDSALRAYAAFLPGHSDPLKVVDRLHAFLYFLEGLLPRSSERRCAAALCDGIQRVACHLAQNAVEFERSDVYAQLLRVRIFADWAGAAPLDLAAAQREASLLAGFQSASADPRLDGGFYFGRKAGAWLPYINPVSTAFSLQALALWEQRQAGTPADWRLLI